MQRLHCGDNISRCLRANNTSSFDIRRSFLGYFKENGHQVVKGSSLIPKNDPTLLFTNAGMVQFKQRILLGNAASGGYSRAVTSQRCIRAGGKHNDLENVGFTPRHHTLFEMLGNFSFGDYFKEEAMYYAWNFLTKELLLPKDRLQVSVYHSDEESALLWKKIAGLSDERIWKLGEKDNFWSMGETGPCGPCSEIFWDKGKEHTNLEDRWLELWNLVFMQYNRKENGDLETLISPCVDTGMGLERISSVLQNTSSNYETDVFHSLIHAIAKQVGMSLVDTTTITPEVCAIRVIADHFRSSCFLIAEGIVPSSSGRGYVLRRILRRAILYGKKLGMEKPFLSTLFPTLLETLPDAEDLEIHQNSILNVLYNEELAFFLTINRGVNILDQVFRRDHQLQIVDGKTAFQLYDSYGFPLDLTKLLAQEKGWKVDEIGFEKLMQEQRSLGRISWNSSKKDQFTFLQNQGVQTSFTGYDRVQEDKVKVLDCVTGKNNETYLFIDPCPFYPQGGGQCGDQGYLQTTTSKDTDPSKEIQFHVIDTISPFDGGIALRMKDNINQNGMIIKGDTLVAVVDKQHRQGCSIHHTATHLLHSALRKVLGNHIFQAGSYVGKEKLRFDFSHNAPLTKDQIDQLETHVNQYALADLSVHSQEMDIDEAKALGALAQFGEKYGHRVRVVNIEGASTEFCGGTHVTSSSELFPFKILSEISISSGTRRIEAIAGKACILWFQEKEKTLSEIAQHFKVAPNDVFKRIENVEMSLISMEKENKLLLRKLATSSVLSNQTGDLTMHHNMKYKLYKLDSTGNSNLDKKLIKEQTKYLASQNCDDAIHLLLLNSTLACCIHPSFHKTNPKAHAGNVIKSILQQTKGNGGGNATYAQATLLAHQEVLDLLNG